MAITNYPHEGYGQIELNRVAFRRSGKIEAQCALGSDFSAEVPAENGMLLAVNKAKNSVGFAADGNLPIGINYSTEHMYDERANALKDFRLVPGEVLPRIGFLSVGDTFTTNAICYNSTDFSSKQLFEEGLDGIKSTPLYGGCAVGSKGMICITKATPAFGPKLAVIKKTTMPDGQLAVKFQVIAEQ